MLTFIIFSPAFDCYFIIIYAYGTYIAVSITVSDYVTN